MRALNSLVRQGHDDLIGALHHVGVGHDEPIWGQDEARTNATLFFFGLRALGPLGLGRARPTWHGNAKKAPQQLLHFVVRPLTFGLRIALYLFCGAYIDHRGPDLFHQVGEIRQIAGLGPGY